MFDVSEGRGYRLSLSMQSPEPIVNSHPFRLSLAALALACCAGSALGQTALVGNSPFAPSGNAVVTGSAPAQDYELAGSTSEDKQVSVCIFERQTKRSAWIPVGGNVDGIHVISFDNNHDTAVVMVAGQRKEISMRKAMVAKSTGAAPQARPAFAANAVTTEPAAPIASAPQPAPAATTAPEQEQREARMLVSDLLEIGVQQRKAYQDAKQKAASGQAPATGN